MLMIYVMQVKYAVLLVLLFFCVSWGSPGMEPVCACRNPQGMCSIICAQQASPSFAKFVYQRPRAQSSYLSPAGLIRPRKQSAYSARVDALCEPITVTKNLIYTYKSVYTTTKIRTKYQIVHQTGTKTLTNTSTSYISVPPSISVLSVPYTKLVFSTTTITHTEHSTISPNRITVRSIQMVTPLPGTITSTVRSPPSVYTTTTSYTVTSIKVQMLTKTITKTITKTQSIKGYSTGNAYVNIEPLPNRAPGVMIEFHDVNHQTKRVNVMLPDEGPATSHSASSNTPRGTISSTPSDTDTRGIISDTPKDTPNALVSGMPNALVSDTSNALVSSAYTTITVVSNRIIRQTHTETERVTSTRVASTQVTVTQVSTSVVERTGEPIRITEKPTALTITKTEYLTETPYITTRTITETERYPVTVTKIKPVPSASPHTDYVLEQKDKIILHLKNQLEKTRNSLDKIKSNIPNCSSNIPKSTPNTLKSSIS
ncbi:hypothetical protein NEFER03_2086 [Nematocida sp. LUAm3]|nr:hypothetical protein NEFER03_2086 [Nematocida sp. LUAm3]KAI5176196.1 hypothetical protein NEFER02_2002 [Nematocida sp. LUAm2]KAI5179184.1 hypothetical protein NEFER01_2041 [Nematocida sp. LUAm1]